MKFVYVKFDSGFEKREVITGETSAGKVVIYAGLIEGETVSMVEPKLKKIKKTTLLPKETKEKVKKLISFRQSQKKPLINGAPPRSGSGGDNYIIIMY